MKASSNSKKRYACFLCRAAVGQLFPFCEWCGAKHSYTSEGELILTGAICQNCGFQSEFPLARCPECEAERRLLCPACSRALPLRMDCSQCGLRWRFFDRLRRENQMQRTRGFSRQPLARLAAATVLLAAVAFSIFAAPGDRWSAAVVFVVWMPIAAGFIINYYVWRGLQTRSKARNAKLVAVLETFDPAEAAHARMHLKHRGIEVEVETEAQHAVSSPPGWIRRVLVRSALAENAHGLLSDGGFNVGVGQTRQTRNSTRNRLKLIEGGSDQRQRPAQDQSRGKSPE
jgi:hypothetical protein